MSKILEMETLGGYQPANGCNTFRKASVKYGGVMPGQLVLMTHRDVDDAEMTVATELLRVKAVSTGPLSEMLEEHAFQNHGVTMVRPDGGVLLEEKDIQQELFKILREAYGEDLGEKDLFVVIHFD